MQHYEMVRDFAAIGVMHFDTPWLLDDPIRPTLCNFEGHRDAAGSRGASMLEVLSQTFRDFVEDECPRLAAALAYYTFFSLPALLVAIVYLGGLLVDRQAVEEQLTSHFEETIGRAGAERMIAILHSASRPQQSWQGWIVGTGMLLLGATGALQELQTALNRAWHVEPDPGQGGLRQFFIKRLLSLALLLIIALLVIVSLAGSWGLAAFGQWIDAHPNLGLSSQVIAWLHTGISLLVITLLFAVLLKFLPDARVRWTDVWLGAVVTAVLFWLGQSVIGMYLAWSRPTSAYGAAGSLALVLLWMYYSAMAFFLGAEFTHALAQHRGKRVPPVHGARRAETGAGDRGVPSATR
jgi:membrane protein